MHCELGSTTNVIFEELARSGIANDLEFDDISSGVRERCQRSGCPIESSDIDRDVASGVKRVDRRPVLCFGQRNLFECLHGYLTVTSVLVAVASDAVTVFDFDRIDGPHIHAGGKCNLKRNNLSHRYRLRASGYGGAMDTSPSRIPPPPGEEEIPIHTRTYDVKTYRVDAGHMRLRGRVTDTKPPGLYVRGDTEPLDVHDMVVDLVVSFPFLEVTSINVVLDTHPHLSCTEIEPTFEKLVGLSIARGFNRQLTQLFGGPRGCTHVVALLRAMGPVAIQSIYSMEAADPSRNPADSWNGDERNESQKEHALVFIRDSCHIWAADGDRMAAAEAGEAVEAPIWIRERLTKLGRSEELKGW